MDEEEFYLTWPWVTLKRRVRGYQGKDLQDWYYPQWCPHTSGRCHLEVISRQVGLFSEMKGQQFQVIK